MLGEALERLPGEVEAIEGEVLALEVHDDAQALGVVIEAAVVAHGAVERALAGVAERRMAEIVGERERLGEILVEAKLAGDGARDLRHLEAMGQARAIVVALVEDEDLRLVDEAAEGGRVEDAVAVALEGAAGRAFGLGIAAAARGDRARGIGGGQRARRVADLRRSRRFPLSAIVRGPCHRGSSIPE